MMKCPDCGGREPFSTVKCACGYMFPLEVRKREEGRLGHEREKLKATLVRYPALRITAKLYRGIAGLAGVVGAVRLILNLRAVWPEGGAKALSGGVVALELIMTGLTIITSLAIAEGIAVLCEINDRGARKTGD